MDDIKTRTEPLRFAERMAIVIATAGGAGYVPKMPGTAGALVGVVIYVGLQVAGLGRFYLHAIIFVLIVGTWAAGRAERLYGRDSQKIAIDEVIGQMMAFALVYRLTFVRPIIAMLLAFGLFRLFDVVKPYPLRRLEQLPGGVGVIADDLGAGFYTLATLAVLESFLRPLS